MKNIKISIITILFTSVVSNQAVEYGRHDGSDYCYYIPGSADNKIYPTSEQKAVIVDTYYQDHTVCTKERHVVDMNFDEIKNMFPIFNQTVHGYPLTFLDSGATAQMPQSVLQVMIDYYMHYKSNAGRGLYEFAEKTTAAFEEVRGKVANFIGAKEHEIVFTQGATAGINLVAHIWAKHHLQRGDEIIVSEVEHNANFIPWQQLAHQKGLTLTIVPINDRGVVDPETLQEYISQNTKLVALCHQSNVLGTTNDIAALSPIVHAAGAKLLVDAAQSVAHQKLDVSALGCDFLVFSGHKLYGPTGVGALYINENLFDQIILENFGGGMVYLVELNESEFKEMPHCLEAGTQPIAQVIGLGAAIDFVEQYVNYTDLQHHETRLALRMIAGLQQIDGVTIISHIPDEGEHTNLVTFSVEGYHSYDIAQALDEYGIAVRAGYHCVHLFHEKIGTCSVRVTFSMYNNERDVDFFIDCLAEILGDNKIQK